MATKKKVTLDNSKVIELIKKAGNAKTPYEAVQYSQAAKNTADALYSLASLRSYEDGGF
jgi:hypothetical protein